MRSRIYIFLTCVFILNVLCLLNYHYSINKVRTIDYKLNGDNTIVLNYKEKYKDELFDFVVNGKKYNLKKLDYKIESNLDINTLGEYDITYKINFNDNNYELKRHITVSDLDAPVIKADKEIVSKSICKKNVVSDLSFTAIDNYDGLITDKVVKEEFEDRIVLTVSDTSGNISMIELPIIYVDSGFRYIRLHGTDKIYVKKGSNFIDDGAYISDECGNIITDNITGISNVDVNNEGNYKISYEFDGKVITRDVIVYNKISDVNNYTYNGKVVYLTFDDGPGMYTERLLSILKKYDVKATFFVTSQFSNYVPLIYNEYNDGHKLAVHSLTHQWTIYKSIESYMEDFNAMNNIIKNYTGQTTNLFRFPGGSSNKVSRSYAKGIMSALTSKMTADGYIYFDWNVDSRDAEGKSSAEIKNNVINGISKNNASVVLMHDIKKNTVDVIEEIIQYGINNGYTFKTLDEYSPTCHHGLNN